MKPSCRRIASLLFVLVYRLFDEEGREVHSEKVVEIVLVNGQPVRHGDQFGLGRE